MGHGGGDPVKVIKAALYANFAIAVIKFIAASDSDGDLRGVVRQEIVEAASVARASS